MNIRAYLPSTQLTSIALSIALSAGFIIAANIVTTPPAPKQAQVDTSTPSQNDNSDWEAALYAIEAQDGASSTAPAPSPASVDDLVSQAQSSNLTDSVGRTLLIKLANAKSQGLGDDIPTQEEIIAQTASEAAASATSTYTLSSLTIVPDSQASLSVWGNDVMKILAAHPDADQNATFAALGKAVDTGAESALAPLPHIGEEFSAIAEEIAALPVPQTLSPLALSTVNDFAAVSASYGDMGTVLTDPLRGLEGFQSYQSHVGELNRVFTQIAENFKKDGILFTKDEPGSAWGALLSP